MFLPDLVVLVGSVALLALVIVVFLATAIQVLLWELPRAVVDDWRRRRRAAQQAARERARREQVAVMTLAQRKATPGMWPPGTPPPLGKMTGSSRSDSEQSRRRAWEMYEERMKR